MHLPHAQMWEASTCKGLSYQKQKEKMQEMKHRTASLNEGRTQYTR